MGLGGLEPPTSRLSGVRSNRLSYRPGLAEICSEKLTSCSFSSLADCGAKLLAALATLEPAQIPLLRFVPRSTSCTLLTQL